MKRAVFYKKLGAASQAKVIDMVLGLTAEPEIKGLISNAETFDEEDTDTSKMATVIVEAVRVILGRRWEDVVEILFLTTDITSAELEADGDDAISLDEIVGVLIKAYEKNDITGLMKRLGNVATPAVKVDEKSMAPAGVTNPNPISPFTSNTHSRNSTVGEKILYNK